MVSSFVLFCVQATPLSPCSVVQLPTLRPRVVLESHFHHDEVRLVALLALGLLFK